MNVNDNPGTAGEGAAPNCDPSGPDVAGLTTVAQEFFHLAATGRPRPATAFALDLLTRGHTVDSIVIEVLAPVQRHVGDLWQRNEWSVAQEHAATAVVEAVVGALALETRPSLGPAARGTVLVACVEEEYHAVAARLGAERLRSHGWDVTFLGASLPAADLQTFAFDQRVDVVVLSCTMPRFLHGAARCLAALGDLGLPTVVAGAAFGATSHRADRLGASGWIAPGGDPTRLLSTDLRPPGPPLVAHVESRPLELQEGCLVTACLAEMPSDDTTPCRGSKADLANLLRHLRLALDFDDPQLFDDHVRWSTEVGARRGAPVTVMAELVDITAGVLARAGFASAAAICSSTSSAPFEPDR